METKLKSIEWTHWSEPCILKVYKYKGYIIQKINQVSISKFSVHHRTRFRGIKNGETVTNECLRYSDCIYEIKQIIARNKKGFYFCGKEVSWEEIPIDVRKHNYPYYFDDNGNDCYPIVTDKRLK